MPRRLPSLTLAIGLVAALVAMSCRAQIAGSARPFVDRPAARSPGRPPFAARPLARPHRVGAVSSDQGLVGGASAMQVRAEAVRLVARDARPTPPAAASPAPQVTRVTAQQLFQQATSELLRAPLIAAKLRQRGQLFGQELVGSGTYLQGPAHSQWLRLELKLLVGNRVHNLEQVCDGEYLWVHTQIAGEPVELRRIEVRRGLAALRQAGAGQVTALSATIGLGGLPRVCQELERAATFFAVRPVQLAGQPAWRLDGRWTSAQWARLLPDQRSALAAGEPPDLKKLPDSVPDRVVVFIDQADRLPRRFDYRRDAPTEFDSGFVEADGERVLLSFELLDLRRQGQVQPHTFAYHPGQQPYDDITEDWVEELRISPPR